MDFRRPVQAVIPGVQGRILAVLAETTAELNLRTIARLSGVSPAQASRVLPELVALGLVERREAPPSALFALIEDNVAGRLVRSLSRSRETVLEELGALARQMDPTPVSAIVFGSLARGEADSLSDVDVVLVRARGEADSLSDVDVVLVRPTDVDEDDEAWVASTERWRTAARRLTGNTVQVVEIDEGEVARRLRRPAEFWANLLREGIVAHGRSLESLRGRRSA